MKNKLLVGLFLMIATIFSMTVEVKASMFEQFYVETKLDDMWTIREEANGTKHRERARVIRRRSDNSLAYCVEPWQDLIEDMMVEGTITNHAAVLNISSETWEKVSLYAYYGYGYQNHLEMKWYVITQLLIWRTIDPSSDFYFVNLSTNSRWDDRFADEFAEIERLVSDHYKSPDFGANKFTTVIGETITLNDSNNILSKFDVSSNNNIKIQKNGNQLSLTPNEIGTLKIELENSDKELTTPPIIYPSAQSQDILVRGKYDPVNYNINLEVIGGKVTVQKQDKDTLAFVGQGDATLKGATYGIYKEDGTYITDVTTDENGYAKSDYLPSLGRFYLQEKSASLGYELDSTKYYFEITESNLEPNVVVQEKVIERNITFFKVYASNETGFLIGEPNVTFDVYLKSKNEKYTSFTTDENGYASVKLPYGVYVVKQRTATENYEKIEDFEIKISAELPEQSYKLLSNAPIKAKLKITKIDEETQMIIPVAGIKFKIKNLDTNEYVCQRITYPEVKTICEYETTSEGILYTPFELLPGNYELEEMDQKLDYYLWNQESLKFSIGENAPIINDEILGTILEVRFSNKQVKGKITIHKKGEEVKIDDGTYEYVKIDLEGVKFEIRAKEDIIINNYKYYSKGDLVAILTTDENGFASIENLPLGTYTIQEISSSLNHMVNDKIYEVELTYKDQYTEVVIEELEQDNYLPKGNVEITKTDVATSEGIPNTKLEVYYVEDENSEGKLIFSGLTDSEGKIILEGLFTGKFYIIEREPAEGYKITDEVIFFEIKENGEIVKANIKNEKIKSIVKIHKVDENNNPIEGVTIGVYDLDGKLISSGITDEFGDIEMELEYGSYYWQEIAPKEGFILSEEKVYFDVTTDGEIIQNTLVNEMEEIEVPDTLANSHFYLLPLGLILIGLAMIFVEKRKNEEK